MFIGTSSRSRFGNSANAPGDSGSNGKWLVLCDELFEEVCDDFTVRKLDISLAEKRALFDAEWVSQVTYELITKPARPRRRNANRSNRGRTPNSAGPAPERHSTSEPSLADSGNWSEPTSQRTLPPATHRPTANEHAVLGPAVPNDTANSKTQSTGGTSTPNANDQTFRGGPAWFTTILN
ncbi:hypothetical protein CBER1_01596 [Cercospora berteroae]|uniref:Uncharacterized protein n=1 Tax=Cercospora berteroae TaxID=357750 RepID=A0A2S6C7V5_9PEZI|nr:hypothetical protein CBER1_01596 [Cercospora berteroae]